MEIRRFGIGHRRHDGPPGTRGVEATPVHVDDRGVIAELALRLHAALAPHTNPNLAYFLVIEGGGFVQVGDERARVSPGEAVVWPANVVHSAWTELTPMRAIVVEFAAPDDYVKLLLSGADVAPLAADVASDGGAAESDRGSAGRRPASAAGGLVTEPTIRPPDRESPEEEPW